MILGELTYDEYHEFLEISALLEAIELNPTVFSREETISSLRRLYNISKRVHERLELQPDQKWTWLRETGVVVDSDH